jgi:ACS family tartrate transporter-like MFS transporter
MARTLEQTTMRKVYWRLLPFAILTYFLCYLDRINVGFAALTMNKDLGLDAAVYGMAAGAFFWGYFLFQVPSNIILEKVGAWLWIARFMVTWGLISGTTAFCVGPWSFTGRQPRNPNTLNFNLKNIRARPKWRAFLLLSYRLLDFRRV